MSKKEDASSALTLILLFIVFFIAALVFSVFLFLVAPGAAITALIAYLLGQQIDLGQAWVFAIAISAVIIFGYHLFFRNPKGTQNAYLFTCTIVAGIYALASLGFHAGWANAHLAYFLPYLMGTQENRAVASEQTSSGQPAQEQKKNRSTIGSSWRLGPRPDQGGVDQPADARGGACTTAAHSVAVGSNHSIASRGKALAGVNWCHAVGTKKPSQL